jgi:predicted dehydrogenase
MSKQKTSRRAFMTKMATGVSVLAASPGILSAKTNTIALRRKSRYAPNDQIQIAVIGAGGMGTEDIKTAISVDGVKLVAACDLYDGRLHGARELWGKDIDITRDYHEILGREDIDAVIIATPDHWHKKISVEAMHQGKAVYCEKPMVHSIDEGPEVIKAQQKTGQIFQVGSQGMSSLGNEKAKELFEAGAIGELNYAEGFWARNSPVGAWQYPVPLDASPETVGWDTYVSNTVKRPFDPLRFFRWRNYRDYGTGVSGDLFVHLFSSLHFVVSSKGPNKIQATGGLRYWKDGREVPDVLLGMFDYPDTENHPAFNLSLRVNFVDGTSGSTYLRLVGSEGAMDVTWTEVILRKNIAYEPAVSGFTKGKTIEDEKEYQRKMMRPPAKMIYQVEDAYAGAHFDHFYNFFNGIRTGKQVNEDAVFGYRAAAPALACNDSYFDNKIVYWDPQKMKLIKAK